MLPYTVDVERNSERQRPGGPNEPQLAFTQGVGLIYQLIGVTTFIALMFVCFASGLLSSSTAIRQDLTEIGWGSYSVQKAITVSLCAGIFCGIAIAGLGLGMQATHRRTPIAAMLVTGLGGAFFLFHAYFFLATWNSWKLSVLCLLMGLMLLGLAALASIAISDMRKSPPAKGFNVLPKDYKVPYSHMHQDPPEVRLQRELEQRKEQLAVQHKELELMEEKLKRKLDEK
jgi:hypothetical protein